MRYSEKWGDSVDAAVKLALADLGLNEDQVVVTVLEEPTNSFFGLFSNPAKVRVEEKMPEKAVKAAAEKHVEKKAEFKKEAKHEIKREPKQEEIKESKKDSKKEVKKETKKALKSESKETSISLSEEVASEKPADLVEAPNHAAQAFLTDLVREMGLNVSVKTSVNDKMVYIDIDGPDSGTVIGKRGATLDAIQYLTSLVVNKDESGYIRVVINAEGYREKREKTLEKLANRLADKAIRNGKSVRLEPMNPYERKVIHTTLQSRPEVRTRSEGEEPYRKVVIDVAKK